MSIVEEPTTGNGYVGQAMRRKEDPRLIRGRATYVDDIVAARHAVDGARALHRGAREGHVDRCVGRARAPGRRGRLHGRRPARGRRALPDVLGAERARGARTRALAAGQGPRRLRRPADRGRDRHRPLLGPRRGRARRGRLRPAAGRRRSREGARGGRPDHPRAVRHQRGVRELAARRRRRRAGARRLGRRRRAADRQPPHGRRGDRAARGAGGVARRQAHALELHADPARRAHRARDPARDARRTRSA